MTVNQALIVCEILKFHGYGDYSLTTDCGYAGIGQFPNSYDKDNKIINMEGMKAHNSDKWICHDDLIQVCDEIEEALKGAGQL